MKLVRLEVQDFRGVGTAAIEFGPGLTVLHGPNELGKSTLVEAIRAALFLQTGSQAGNEYVTWGRSLPACVTLTFEHDGKLWRASKRFGHRRHATLQCSESLDPPRFREVVNGNGVEGRLRELLTWGIAQPGGRGAAPKTESFLLTALLGRQGGVQDILSASLDADRDDSGKSLVTRAIGALDKDPVVTRIIERLTERVEVVFTSQGRFKTAADSPLVKLQEHLKAQEERLGTLQEDDRNGKRIQADVVRLQDECHRLLGARESADADWEAAKAQAERIETKAKLQAEIDEVCRLLAEAERLTTELESLDGQLNAAASELKTREDSERSASSALEITRHQRQAAAEAVARETEGAEQSGRVKQAALAQQRAELDAERIMTQARLKDVAVAEQAVADAAALDLQLTDAGAESIAAREAVMEAARTLEHATVRVKLDDLMARQDVVASACVQLAEAQQREQAARERLDAAVAAVVAAEGRRDRWDLESQNDQIREAEAELHLLRAVEAKIGLELLRSEVRVLQDTAARARTARTEAQAGRSEASAIDHRLAQRVLPTREQIAAWRELEQELSVGPAPASGAAPSLLISLAIGLAGGFVVAAAAYLALAAPLPTAIFAGLVVAVIVGGLVWVDRRGRTRAQATAEYEHQTRCRARWTQEVEPSMRAAGLANLADFEGTVAEVEGLKDRAQRLRHEADQHDIAAAAAERGAAALDTRLDALARVEGETPVTDTAAVSERMAAFHGNVDTVRQCAIDLQQTLETTRERLRVAASEDVRTAAAQRVARQIECDAVAREVVSAETRLTLAQQQTDSEALTRLRARLAEIGEVVMPTASVVEASAALAEAQTRQTRTATKVEDLRIRCDEAYADMDRRVRTLGGSPEDARRQVEQDLDTLATRLAALEAASNDDSVGIAARSLAQAKAAHVELTQQFESQQAALEAAGIQRKEAERGVRDLRTAIEVRRAQLAGIDRPALDARLQIATGDPVFQVSDDARLDPVGARAVLDDVGRQLAQCTSELDRMKGQLHLIAGHVGTERLQQQEEAVRHARAEVLERECAEQAALRLLREIQQAEAERATHLGRALAGPITHTFCTLTGGRYGAIAFASDLKTEHIEADGEPRKLESLSVGTREQLATLLRLAIAGHLQTTVVLDDQLVHSDSARLEWFSDRLRASAAEHAHQVIVFTCRPGDYVRAGMDDGVTVVDLASLVSR